MKFENDIYMENFSADLRYIAFLSHTEKYKHSYKSIMRIFFSNIIEGLSKKIMKKLSEKIQLILFSLLSASFLCLH